MKKTVLVTGAGKGIGAAIARRFTAQGDRVAVHYCRSEAQARALCEDIARLGGEAFPVGGDLTDPAQVRRVFSLAEYRMGGLDVLVNNAGISLQKPFRDTNEADWDGVFDACLKSAFLCTQAALPFMLERRAGCIVNVSSVWGQTGASGEVAYSAAKAGLIGLTRALAKELGPSGIRVNCVAPGVIDTDMTAQLTAQTMEELTGQTPLGRIGHPEDVAGAVVFLASEEACFITGQIVSPNGGLWVG